MNLMQQSVLVLNKYYQPVDVYTVEEALISVCKGKSEIVDAEYRGYDIMQWAAYSAEVQTAAVRTVKHRFLPPEVVRLIEFDEHLEVDVNYTRENVFYRDGHTCQYCGVKCIRTDLTIDHVLPWSRRKEFGLSDKEAGAWENVVCACKECNVTKSNRTPEEAGMPLLSKPIEPSWIGKVRGVHPANIKASWKPFLKG